MEFMLKILLNLKKYFLLDQQFFHIYILCPILCLCSLLASTQSTTIWSNAFTLWCIPNPSLWSSHRIQASSHIWVQSKVFFDLFIPFISVCMQNWIVFRSSPYGPTAYPSHPQQHHHESQKAHGSNYGPPSCVKNATSHTYCLEDYEYPTYEIQV